MARTEVSSFSKIAARGLQFEMSGLASERFAWSVMMRPFVLVGSSSAYRRSLYPQQLERHGFDGVVVSGGIDCIRELRLRVPDVLVLECAMLWGGVEGVLDHCSMNRRLENIPVLLLSSEGVSASAYRLARFPVYGFFGRFPTAFELAAAISNTLQSRFESQSELKFAPAMMPL